MSQHRTTVTHKGKPVSVIAGWDRPLQYYFLLVERPNGRVVFDSMTLPEGGFRDIEGVKAKLDELGIVLPLGMVDEIAADGAANIGNKLVEWEAA